MVRPINDEHALLCGMVWGMAMRHGLPMNPVMDRDDADGYDYSDTLELELPPGYGGEKSPVRVFLVVQPPTAPVPDLLDRLQEWGMPRRDVAALGMSFGDVAGALPLLPGESRALRAANHISVLALAAAADVSERTVKRFENDEPISMRNLAALLAALERLAQEEVQSRG